MCKRVYRREFKYSQTRGLFDGRSLYYSWFPQIFDIVALDLSSCQLGNRVHWKRQPLPKCLLSRKSLQPATRAKSGESCPMVWETVMQGPTHRQRTVTSSQPACRVCTACKTAVWSTMQPGPPHSRSDLRLYGWATYGRFAPLHSSAPSTDAKPSTTRLNGRSQ